MEANPVKKKNKGNHRKKLIVVGITGGIASGKKTIARILKNFGADVISADEVYSDLIRHNVILRKKIVRRFGSKILDNEKNIDRRKLSKIVFRQASKLKILNKVTHPVIARAIKSRIKKTLKKIVVVVAPLLIESGYTGLVDTVWLISLNRRKQAQRLMKRDSSSYREALRKIDSQMSVEEKIPHANVVIDNSESFENTKKQVISAWGKIIEELKEISWK